jgi:hypothetical protein
MKQTLIIAALLTAGLSAWGQSKAPWSAEYRLQQVQELKREGRLPGWANYICGEDQQGMYGAMLMLIGYQEGGFTQKTGYMRGLTYQEYFGMDEKNPSPVAVNLPMTPESVELETGRVATLLAAHTPNATTTISFETRMNAELIAADNQIALTKDSLGKGYITEADMKDEMIQAMLDGPYGTNWHAFVSKHPEAWEYWLARQKYENAGMFPDDVKIYREGNVIYEAMFGSGLFETATGMDKSDLKSLVNTRIQMSSTASGLRYTVSTTYGSIGIPISGACDGIAR